MELISDEYRALNARAHEDNNGYGVSGHRHHKVVLALLERFGCASMLDYGCGQASLGKMIKRLSPVAVANYDPAVPEYNKHPEPADLVVCTDVMEHVEPLYLTRVLEDLTRLTNKAIFFEIACRPAKRILADGRNAHILQQPGPFWYETLRWHFDILEYRAQPNHSVQLVCVPKGAAWE